MLSNIDVTEHVALISRCSSISIAAVAHFLFQGHTTLAGINGLDNAMIRVRTRSRDGQADYGLKLLLLPRSIGSAPRCEFDA